MSGAPLQPLTAARLALLARRARQDNLPALLREPIAIIGMGCRLPGGADTPLRFWQLMLDGFDAITEVPADRWSVDEWFDPDPATPGRTSVKDGGFIADVSGFDADFFGISPREAERMDPHQRIALEVAWQALEDAGLRAGDVWERQVGVFAASYNNDYVLHQYLRRDAINERTITGVVHSIVANRISYYLGLHGPSLTIDTACSSSLVAVHLACQTLRSGGCDIALAGGVSLMTRPEPFVAMSKAGFMAPDGRCKTFDARADGFGRGEGCGFIVLKRLSDALAAGDRIDAVIRGSAVNQDGRSTVLAAPNGRAQVDVVRAALADAQVDPANVGFIEAHGTGTRLGDPIEVEALAEALGAPRSGVRLIASVKANIGHLEAAAGIAGLIKAVLCLKAGRVPRQVQFTEENPLLQLAQHAFEVPLGERAWPGSLPSSASSPSTDTRIAGVSSFGIGGTNAHVVLESAPSVPSPATPADGTSTLLLLSARTAQARSALALRYADQLDRGNHAPQAAQAAQAAQALAAAAAVRRTRFDERLAVVGSGAREIAERLRAGEPAVITGRVEPADEPRIVFVCNGQGSQWAGMARQLMEEEPGFRSGIEAVDAIFAPLAGWSLLDALDGRDVPYTLDDTACAQPLIFAVQVALARVFDTWGVRPFAVTGHSIGELAAAHIAGIATLEEVVPMVFHRSRVMQQAAPDGAMLAARMSPEEAALIAEGSPDVVVAGLNAPRSIVFSGKRDAVTMLAAALTARGVQVKELAVQYGFHSAQMRPLEAQLRDALRAPAAAVPRALFISTVTGDVLPAAGFDATYVARNVVSPVRFDAAIRSAARAGGNIFLELGPRAVLGTSILEILESERKGGTVAAAVTQRDAGRAGLLSALGALYCAGVEADWARVLGNAPVDTTLPLYPWQHQRFWLDGDEHRSKAPASIAGDRIDSPAIDGVIFQRTLDIASHDLGDHRIGGQALVPGAMMLEMARTAGEIVLNGPVTVRDAQFLRPISLEPARQAHLWLRPADGGLIAELYTRTENTAWVLSFRAVLAAGVQAIPSQVPAAADAGLQPLDVGAFYDDAATRGCDFGGAFRRISEMRRGNDVMFAVLDPRQDTGAAGIVPSLLDAALQPAIALLDDTAGLYVPSAVESFRRLHARVPVASRVRGRKTMVDKARCFDVDLLDDGGTVVACVEGLLLRPAPGDYAAVQTPSMYGLDWQALDAEKAAAAAPLIWMIVGARADHGAELADMVTAAGATAHAIESARDAVTAMKKIAESRRPLGWIVVTGANPLSGEPADVQSALAGDVLEVLHCARRGESDRFVLLSAGAQTTPADTDPGAAPPWSASLAGMARAFRREHGSALCAVVDLDPAPHAHLPSDLLDAPLYGEPLLAHRAGRWLVPRLRPVEPRTLPSGAPSVLALETPGDLTSIRSMAAEPRTCGADEIEIEVRWGALNFRDVLGALGVVAVRNAAVLGHECAGVVKSVGNAVNDVMPGDEVLALAEGAFGSIVVCRRTRVFRRPAAIGWAQSATLPIAYLTAWHALVTVAQLRAGQRVLIHSGAGGVGLAAIRIALSRGAVVYATAGTPGKRAYLEQSGVTFAADSRGRFSADILAATGGEGVDVVLNSLTREAVDAGLVLLRNGGCFIELGKRDLRDPSDVEHAHQGVRYVAFDLFDELDRDPTTQAAAYAQLAESFESGALMPLPHVIFPRENAADAFQLMARGAHTGKILLSFARERHAVRSDATYLVTGGTGLVGMATAAWLVERGARSLVLASRMTPPSETTARIATWRAAGVDVTWHTVDLATADSVSVLMQHVRGRTLPLRGVVHAAGTLDDCLVASMDAARFMTPFAAKVDGAWNIVRATAADELDFLLLYSAAGSLLDPAGQGNYAGANAVIDAMAARLRGQGHRATSVAWGLWQGGMAEQLNDTQLKRWHAQGLRPIDAAQAAAMLDQVLDADEAFAMPVLIDWPRFFRAREDADPLVAAMRGSTTSGTPDTQRAGARLRALRPHRQRAALRELLIECVGRVLGRTDLLEAGADRPLRDLGLDSLMAVELRNMLTRELGHAFSATLAFDYPDVPALTAHIAPLLFGASAAQEYPDAAVAVEARALPRPVTPAVEDLIAAMTEEEAELELMAELGQLGAITGELKA